MSLAKGQRHSSRYYGITKRRGSGKWFGQIRHSGQYIFVGTFLLEEQAARAVDRKLRELGLPARNFPTSQEKQQVPTYAQKERIRQIEDYFRRTYLGRITTINQAADDLRTRFHLTPQEWYRRRRELIAIMQSEKATDDNGQPEAAPQVVAPEERPEAAEDVLVVPSNLNDEAKEAFSRLFNENQRLATSVQMQDLELGSLRNQTISQNNRIRLLKGLVEKLTEAI